MPKILVRVVSAKNLDLVSESAYQEPWVVVKLGRMTSTIKASPEPKLIKKNANPQFNQVLDMEFEDVNSARLEVEVRDVDERGKETLIGAVRLRLQNLAKRVSSTASYKMTVPHVSHSKAELELSLEAQDFDTSNPESFSAPSASSSSSSSASSSYIPGGGHAAMAHSSGSVPLNNSGGILAPQPSSSSAPSSSSGYPHVGLPSHSPAAQPHQAPSRAVVQQYPPPIQYNPKDIQRVHPHIAKGSYGVVYKGHVPDVKELVVIKDMDFTNQKALEDWKKEIKMMAKTSCEYVVRVLGYSTSERTLTIVMEFMTKGSLYDVLHTKKETLSVITRMRMARHCALGLQHLHELKVMHRDIKSMNILVSDSYACKLTDFGCAKSLNEQGAILNTANSGTPLWMAPEVKLGQYDYSADIYSLGLVIYELLEKRLPQYDQIRATVVLPAQYDSKEIVGPCLSPDPRRRPKASEIVHKLDCVIRNIIQSIRKHLKEDELKEMGISPSAEQDQLDSEISALYQILLRKDPKSVDKMVYQAFGSEPERASANQPEVPLTPSMPQAGFMPGAPMPGAPMPAFGMQVAPVGYPPNMQMPFPMPMAFPQQAAYGTPPGIMPINPYQAQQFMMQPKPRHFMNPAPVYQQNPSFAPATSGINPYAAMSAHHQNNIVNHLDQLSKPQPAHLGANSPFADPNKSRYESHSTPSPPPQDVLPVQHNALLVDDPYSDAYQRPESPATRAHAAAIAAGQFDVMKPEKTGQSLLDDLAGLSTSNTSQDREQARAFSTSTDLSDYGVLPSAPAPSSSVSSATPVTPSKQSNSYSRFVPLSPTTGYSVETKLTDALQPSAPVKQGPTSVGTLIDMDMMLSPSAGPAKVEPFSAPNSIASPTYPPPGIGGHPTPMEPSLFSLEAFLAQSASPVAPTEQTASVAVRSPSSSLGVDILIPDLVSPPSQSLNDQSKIPHDPFSIPLVASPRQPLGSSYVTVEKQPPIEMQEKTVELLESSLRQ